MSFEKKIPSDDTLKNGLADIADAIYRLDGDYKIGKTLGGIEIKAKASTGTLIEDYSGLSKEELMTKYPFNQLRIEDVESFKSDGTATGIKDSYLVMPNCWRYDEYSTDGTEIHYIANYKVNEKFYRAYDGDFTELLLGVYFASAGEDSLLHSVSGMIPALNMKESSATNAMPYYKTAGGLRRAEYQDYRIRGLYDTLSVIYLGTRDSQSVYQGICAYPWTGGSYTTDITDSDSQKTGVTEQTTSIGYMPHSVVSGEITGTSTTAILDNGKRPFKLLGIENPYGVLYQHLYGLMHKSGKVYAYKGSDPIPTDKLFPNDTNTTYTDLNMKMPSKDGNQGAQQNANGINVPLNLDGNGSTYNADYYWYTDGWKTIIVGGEWPDGSRAGLLSLRANIGFDFASYAFSFRLSFER